MGEYPRGITSYMYTTLPLLLLTGDKLAANVKGNLILSCYLRVCITSAEPVRIDMYGKPHVW